MRIQIYENGEVYVPDRLLGFVGETNHRKVQFSFTNIAGATNYDLKIVYADGTAYSVPIIGKQFTVTGSMLPSAGLVKCQWTAWQATTENDEMTYTLVGKSKIFELEIGESLDETVAPIPPYEESVSAAEILAQLAETFELGYVTEIKEFLNDEYFKIGVGTTAQIAAAEQGGTIPNNALVIPTDGTDVENFEQALKDIEDLQAATADSGWQDVTMTTPWTAGSVALKCRKIGSRVYLRGRAEHANNVSESKIVATVPEGYRPGAIAQGMVSSYDGSMISTCMVQQSGVIQLSNLLSLATPATAQTYVGKTIVFDLGYFLAES